MMSNCIRQSDKHGIRRDWSPITAALAVGVTLFTVAVATPSIAQTLDQALGMAYSTNPQLLQQRAQLRSTDEQIAQARAGWRPTVTLTGSIGRTVLDQQGVAGSPATVTPKSAAVQIVQPLFRGFRTEQGVARARNQIEAERARLGIQEQQVLLDSSTAYLNVLQNAAVLELNISNEQVLRRQLEATRDRFRVGEVTRTDVSQAESRLAGATADRIAAEATLIASRQTFERTVGTQPSGLIAPSLPGNLPLTADEAASAAATDNPIVIAAIFDEAAAREQIGEIRGELLPTVNLTGSVSASRQAGTTLSSQQNVNSAQTAIQVSVPLYEAGSVYSRTRAARQVATQRQVQIEVARRQAVEQSTTAYENLKTAQARIASLAAQVRAAEIALEGVRQEAAVGSRTVLDVLNAEQELLNAQVSYVRANRDYLVAAYTLLSAAGRLTARSLKLPVELYDYETNYNDVAKRWYGTGIRDE